MHPIRLKNFASLEIDRNFQEITGSWWIVLSPAETKEGRPDERKIDDFLKSALERYLRNYRTAFADRADTPSAALWLSSNDGNPMSYAAVERVITETTRRTVGVSVSPHLFRTSGASSAAIYGGDDPHLASALFHHRHARVTENNYNRASSLSAVHNIRKIIEGYLSDSGALLERPEPEFTLRFRRSCGTLHPPAYQTGMPSKRVRWTIMIRNGLYAVVSKLLDGLEGGATGVSVLQDGTMRGGGSIYYHTGTYSCSDGKWKGELTTREHEPELITKLFARKVVTMGFTGTYTDEAAEFEATALVGKRSARLHVTFRLLIAD